MNQSKYKSSILIIISLIVFYQAKGQEAVYSQYFNNRLLLNPAFAGLDDGIRVNLNHRNLWRQIPDKFVTTSLSIDWTPCRANKMGIGILMSSDVEGAAGLKTNEISGIYSYRILSGKRYSVTTALQAGMVNLSIDWSKFVFSDQLHKFYGNIHTSSNAGLVLQNNLFGDFGSGILYRQSLRSFYRDYFFHLGASMHHMYSGNWSFVTERVELPRRITLHGGFFIPLVELSGKPLFHILPNFRYVNYSLPNIKFKVLDLGADFYAENVLFGLSYRNNLFDNYHKNTDAVVVKTGYTGNMKYNIPLRFTYSYDINIKGVSTGNIGTHEISLISSLPKSCGPKSSKSERKDCLDYRKKSMPQIF